ncbi:MAG TPA: glycosyltransferase [Gemmatimonadales bacterium]|nr:glycosyltransferase [Gemmatimonadales bacterium]
MPRTRRPYDIVHIAQTQFPDDPRPRKEVLAAVETGARVAVIALQDGLDPRPVGHYGRAVVVRLPGQRRRGSLGKYVVEYTDFLVRAYALMRRDPRFSGARVVHVHTLPDFLVAAAAPARRRGARVVLDMHEIFPEFTRTKFPGLLGRLGMPVARAIERWSRRQADVVLTVNRTIERLLAGRPARPGERLVVVHNLTDPADFGPERLGDGTVAGPLRLAYHGTVTPLYGLDIAVAAVAEARAAGADVEFDIYGRGPATSEIDAQIRRLGLEGRVRLMGTVSHHVLRERLTTYHAGLLPTRLDRMTRYSLSTKLLEYVHLGIPLIAARIPTYLEYFPEHAAWYFRPGDAADAARAIRDVAAATPAERMGRARAAQVAARELTWEREAARLKQVYAELLEGAGASGEARLREATPRARS